MEIKKENCIYLASEVENAQWKKDNTLVCPICGKIYVGYGNNLYPIAKDGRCCDDCNLWVILMRCWLGSNDDVLKGLVDKLSSKRCTITSLCQINEQSAFFTFYRDVLTKKLEVVVVGDDGYFEKVVEGTLHNWIAMHYSDKEPKGVQLSPRFPVWDYTNQVKNDFELKAEQSA